MSMILKPDFEIVDLVDEHILVPVGENAESFGGVVALTEAAAFLLSKLRVSKSREELLELLVDEYEVDRDVAELDINSLLESLFELGVIDES